MDLGITDRVALVTGAGRGIGRQICLTLGEEGAKVAVNDVFQERADAVAGEIVRTGGQAVGVVADVTDAKAVTGMVQRNPNPRIGNVSFQTEIFIPNRLITRIRL